MFLFGGQRADAPFAKLPERQRADRNPDQPQYCDAERRQQTSNVTVPALVQDNFEPGIALAAAKHTDIPDSQEISISCRDSFAD